MDYLDQGTKGLNRPFIVPGSLFRTRRAALLLLLAGLLVLAVTQMAFVWPYHSEVGLSGAVTTDLDKAHVVTDHFPQQDGLTIEQGSQPVPEDISHVLSYLPPQISGLYSFRS